MSKVLNVLLTHQRPGQTAALLGWWKHCVRLEGLLIVHGGDEGDFKAHSHAAKVFVSDPRLRTADHQREMQSYTGVFRAVSNWLRGTDFSHVYFCEYDQLPLREKLDGAFLERMASERADVLGLHVIRVDGTSNPHYLYHSSNPRFHRFWEQSTRRPEANVVLSMFGTGSFWKREAFEAVAAAQEPFPMYLELYLPTLAHHLGFRLRDLPDQNPFVQPMGDFGSRIAQARLAGAWTIHPVKTLPVAEPFHASQ